MLILFPALTLISSSIFLRCGYQRLMTRIAVVFFGLQALFFLLYPRISGEPVKDLVGYWKDHPDGDLAVYGEDLKTISWAQAISGGRTKGYSPTVDYVIARRKDLDRFPDREIVSRADRIKRVRLRGYDLETTRVEYLLLRRQPSTD